jgi:hypothetical protein
MNFNFADALSVLGADSVFQYANAVRPTAAYLFNTLLPERPEPTYSVDGGAMTVKSTMAGLAATDSPYPPTGLTKVSTFVAKVPKIANYTSMPEEAVKRMQGILRGLGQPDSIEFIQNEAINFLGKVIMQGHLDTFEWLRGQALVSGEIDWTFNNMNLVIDYGIPTANILTTRTTTESWDSTASAFWDDIDLLQQALDYNVRAYIIHPTTLNKILNNSVNAIELISNVDMGDGSRKYTFTRLIGTTERRDSDARFTVEVIAYGLEAEVLNPAGTDSTQKLPFMQQGKILAVANTGRTGYRVGEGATDDINKEGDLGYTHIGPTVEGGGQMGRWGQLFTPEQLPMQLHGRAVTNGLPVVETPEKIAIASSDLS